MWSAHKHLLDLPEDVLRPIIRQVDNKFPLLLTCKELCFLAGDLVYEELRVSDYSDAQDTSSPPHLLQVIAGIESQSSVLQSFVNGLKGRFLERVQGLVFGLTAVPRLTKNPDSAKAREQHELVRSTLLKDLQQLAGRPGTVVFSSLLNLTILSYGGMGVDSTQMALSLAIASLSCPVKFEWPAYQPAQPAQDSDSDSDDGSYTRPALPPPPTYILSFAGNHLPRTVTHHLPTYRVSPFLFPIPCYGTHNIASLWAASAGDTRAFEYVQKAVRRAHPEAFGDDGQEPGGVGLPKNDEEARRRARTTWEFRWLYDLGTRGADVMRSGMEGFMEKTAASIEKELGPMEGRVTTTSKIIVGSG